MSEWWWILASVLMVLVAVAMAVWTPLQGVLRKARLTDARRLFHFQRERLEAKFIQLAIAQAKPSAPAWTDCEFENDVAYVRNRSTGELAAFVGVTMALERYEGQGEGADDPFGNYRVGTAVFRFDRHRWETDGMLLLNLNPSEAVRFYKDNLEIVAQELAKH